MMMNGAKRRSLRQRALSSDGTRFHFSFFCSSAHHVSHRFLNKLRIIEVRVRSRTDAKGGDS